MTSVVGRAGDIKARMNRFENKANEQQQPNGDNSSQPKSTGVRRGFVMPKREKCRVCNIYVYEMEKLVADEVVYHKTCFKCKKCRNTLRVGNYASLDGQVFCKPHFIELFKQKGNYEEGFGKQRHKNKWLHKQASIESQTNSKQNTPDRETHNKPSSRKHSLAENSSPPASQIKKLNDDDEEKENNTPASSASKPKPTGISAAPAPKPKPKTLPKTDVMPKIEIFESEVERSEIDGNKPMDVDNEDQSGIVTTDPIQVGNMKARFEEEMKRAAAGGAPVTDARRDLEAMRGNRGMLKNRYEEALNKDVIGGGDQGDEEEGQTKPRANDTDDLDPDDDEDDPNMKSLLSRFKAIESGEAKSARSEEDEDLEEDDEANVTIRDELKTMKKASKFRSFFETVSQTGTGGKAEESDGEEEDMDTSTDADTQK